MSADLNKAKTEIKQLQTSFASTQEKFKKIRADYGQPDGGDSEDSKDMEDYMDQMCQMMDCCNASINSLYDYVGRVQSQLWSYVDGHSKGHLPACASVEQLTNAIAALGLDSEYQVNKKQIYASKDGNSIVATLNIKK